VNIWEEEQMLEDFSVVAICLIHKKNDKINCNNYRGISLLNTTYKRLAEIIYKRLKPCIEEAHGEYQNRFRRAR
jgi:sorting nexin-29